MSEDLKPLLTWIPKSLHTKFKLAVARDGITLKSVIITAIENFCNDGKEKENEKRKEK